MAFIVGVRTQWTPFVHTNTVGAIEDTLRDNNKCLQEI